MHVLKLLALAAFAMLLYGCTSAQQVDADALLKANAQLQKLAQEYPNATIDIAYFSEATVAGIIGQMRQDCGQHFEQRAYYKVVFDSQELSGTLWLEDQEFKTHCAKIRNKVQPTPTPAPTFSCPQYAPVSPDFCNGGVIQAGGIGANGCQLPPTCITPVPTAQPPSAPTPAPTAYPTQAPAQPTLPGTPGTTPQPSPVSPELLTNRFAYVEGVQEAKVNVVVFTDFQCQYCKRLNGETIAEIRDEYVAAGKVRMTHRDFPLGFHPGAQKYAEAARCAGDQGGYVEMNDRIFALQLEGDAASSPEEAATKAKQLAPRLGLDSAQFDSCLDSSKYFDTVQADFNDGVLAGVIGVPTVFINGHAIIGSQPYAVFKKAIDAELAK